MKERIILAPGVKGSELARSLALHGVNSMGLRICGAAELARMTLMRSGIAITEDFVSGKEESAIVAEAVLEEPYFNRASYSGIQEIASVLRRMRCLAVSGDESQELERILPRGIFGEKNAALLHVCQRFGTTNDGAILADIARTTVDAAHDRTVQTYRTITVDGSYYMAILEYLVVAYTALDVAAYIDIAVAINFTCNSTSYVYSAIGQDTAHDTATFA